MRFTREIRDFMPYACKQTLGLEDIKTWTVRVESLDRESGMKTALQGF